MPRKEPGDPGEGIGFNMTPMIDVVFQLIIFLMLANDLSRRDIEELTLPVAFRGEEDTGRERQRVIVNLLRNEGGRPPTLRVRGRDMDLEGSGPTWPPSPTAFARGSPPSPPRPSSSSAPTPGAAGERHTRAMGMWRWSSSITSRGSGTMGSASWVLLGNQKSLELTFGSTAHGSGRTMSRTQAHKNYNYKQVFEELQAKGIVLKSMTRYGVVEEAPEVYKDVDTIASISHEIGIATKVARLIPLGVIKG